MDKAKRFHVVSLGCAKNLVDSTGVATLLERAGYHYVDQPDEADLIVVNTCGFIAPARREARQVLRELAATKRPNQCLVAAGCYAQRLPEALTKAVPEIDGVLGTRRWMDVLALVEQLEVERPAYHVPDVPTVGQDTQDVPRIAVQGASGYLKLADGCRRSCAFCAIPLIKGPAVSRPPEDVVEDARWLAEYGAQEIILIAQDTTDYGADLGMQNGLADLLDRLVNEVPAVPWIRLMYAYPSRITDRLIETMARHEQILPYLDLPLQHADPEILRRMRRPADPDAMQETIGRLRQAMPEIALRTTFLVGFPGETEAHFRTLIEFVEEMRFDRVGVFTYSHEPGTPAESLIDDVPAAVKEERRDRLMAVQQPISQAKNQALIGQVLGVLIEGQSEELSVGRSYRDAPEVDGLVLVQRELPVGEILPLRIVGAMEYDLIGEPIAAE